MTKGADSIVLPRVRWQKESKSEIEADLLAFAKQGLRTLVLAQRELSQQEYEKFAAELSYQKQENSLDKDEKLFQMYDTMERNLTYVGSTAIEDKLQYGVPETIAKLIEARIFVWVLTGDKQETAIEIGKSCKLI